MRNKVFGLLVSFAFFGFVSLASAMPSSPTWQFAGYGGGGAFPYVYADPTVPNKVWAISDVASVFESTNNGDSWNWAQGDALGNVGGDTLIQAPSNPQVFYHASGRTSGA